MPADGIVALGPDGGEPVTRRGRQHRILGELPELEIIELTFGPGFEVGAHLHDDHVDSFYVLAGEGEFLVGDEIFRVGPGSFIAAPAGVTHGFRNVTDSELRLLNIHSPNVGFAERLRRP